jgi:radical SAM protein with 4Fe4S-binding SPASM domain
MDYKVYQKLVNQVKDFAILFYFNFAGEPFLNPRLFQMVNEAGKHNIFTMVDTNATLLSPAKIREILTSKLSILVVNIDYIHKEPFECFRKGANFASTMKGIKHLCMAKKKKGGVFPLIIAETIVTHHNEDHLNTLNDFAMNKMGVDGVWFKSLCFPLHSDGFREEHEVGDLVKNYLPRNSSIRRYDFHNGSLELKNPEQLCEWEHKSVILWDGRVAACCFDYDGCYTFGNIKYTPFLDIWNSPKYRYYRQKLIKFKKLDICEYCSII